MSRATIAALCFLSAVVGAALTITYVSYWPKSSAVVAVELPQPQAFLAVNAWENTLSNEKQAASPKEMERVKAGLLVLAKTEPVLRKTLADPRVSETKWHRDNVANAYAVLEVRLSAESVPNTNLLRFSMTGADPNELPGIINAWADAFVTEVTYGKNSEPQKQIADITAQQNAMKANLGEVERDLKTLTEPDERVIPSKLGLPTKELEALAVDLMMAQLAVEEGTQQVKMLDEMVAQGQIDYWGPRFLDDPLLMNLTQDLISLRIARDRQAREGGVQTRPAEDANQRIAALEKEVAERENQVRKAGVQKLRDDYAQQLAKAQSELAAVQARMDELVRKVKALSESLKTATELDARKHALETNIDLLEKRMQELRILQRGERPVYVSRYASITK
jgi:flagellin-like hook-associated protein FlgL